MIYTSHLYGISYSCLYTTIQCSLMYTGFFFVYGILYIMSIYGSLMFGSEQGKSSTQATAGGSS